MFVCGPVHMDWGCKCLYGACGGQRSAWSDILWERATVVFETGSLTEIWDQWSRAVWLARKPGICLSPPPQNCAYKTHTTMPGF